MRDARSAGMRMGRLGILLGLLAVTAGCHPFDNALVAVFGRSMRDSPSFDPYEHTITPPEGSVPFAAGNFPAAPGEWNITGETEGTAIPAPFTALEMVTNPEIASALQNPVPADAESLARGEVMYNRACAPCHGVTGQGEGSVTAAGMLAQSIVGQATVDRADGYIYGMIRVGRGLMPAYGHQVTHYDRWNIVNYVRSLQGVQASAAND